MFFLMGVCVEGVKKRKKKQIGRIQNLVKHKIPTLPDE